MTCCCRHGGDSHDDEKPTSGVRSLSAAARWWVDLDFEGRSARVELPRLITVRVAGRDVARLDDLWAAAHLGPKPFELAFDFVAADGYRLGAKLEGGIDGADLSTGYMCVATRNLIWSPVPERPCFWRVKGVVSIRVSLRTARWIAV